VVLSIVSLAHQPVQQRRNLRRSRCTDGTRFAPGASAQAGNGALRTGRFPVPERSQGTRILIRAGDIREDPPPRRAADRPRQRRVHAGRGAASRNRQWTRSAEYRRRPSARSPASAIPATLATAKAVVNGMALEYVAYDDGARVRRHGARHGTHRRGVPQLRAVERRQPRGTRAAPSLSPRARRGRVLQSRTPPSVGPLSGAATRIRAAHSRRHPRSKPEPAAPPADPFAERVPPACPVASKPVADALIVAFAPRDAQARRIASRVERRRRHRRRRQCAKRLARSSRRTTPSRRRQALQCLPRRRSCSGAHSCGGRDRRRRAGRVRSVRPSASGFYVVAIPGEPSP